jgi:hypothetical protein
MKLTKLTMADVAKSRGAKLYDKTPVPAQETEEGRERLRKYYSALGAFVDSFSKVEMAMQWTLQWQTRMEEFTARAVFSGVRTDATVGHLGRLAEIKKIEPAEWLQLQPVLRQLGIINKVRNLILHYGTDNIAEGRGLVSNAKRALTIERVTPYPISPQILKDMTEDLSKIYLHLAVRHMGRQPLRGKHPYLEKVLAASWRYTAPEPPKKDRQREKKKSQPSSPPSTPPA